MKAADVSASIDTAALRALLDKGTPGRWIAGAAREDGTAQVYCPNRGPMRVIVPVAETEPHNAALISALRNAAPTLLDEVDRLREALAGERRHLLADEERRKLTGDALFAESESAALRAEVARLREALESVRSIASDRERFVMLGPRGVLAAMQIAEAALEATEPKP